MNATASINANVASLIDKWALYQQAASCQQDINNAAAECGRELREQLGLHPEATDAVRTRILEHKMANVRSLEYPGATRLSDLPYLNKSAYETFSMLGAADAAVWSVTGEMPMTVPAAVGDLADSLNGLRNSYEHMAYSTTRRAGTDSAPLQLRRPVDEILQALREPAYLGNGLAELGLVKEQTGRMAFQGYHSALLHGLREGAPVREDMLAIAG